MSIEKLSNLIADIKNNAIQYYQMTGRPLGVTGEIAEFEATKKLKLRLAEVRQSGYDAVDQQGVKIQIKGRCIIGQSKGSQRTGSMKPNKEWDKVILVLLDKEYNVLQIHEASRDKIIRELKKPGSRARNVKGTLGISKFKSIATLVWSNK